VGTRLWRSGIEVRGIPIAFGAALLVFGSVAQDTRRNGRGQAAHGRDELVGRMLKRIHERVQSKRADAEVVRDAETISAAGAR
jgi:hypothetical protein